MLRTAVVAMLVVGSPAFAEQRGAGRRVVVDVEPIEALPQGAVSNILYLERCRGGCMLAHSSVNDAQNMQSTIPRGATSYRVSEFVNAMQQSGAAADEEWNAVLQCLREVYSPYNVVVTDEKPAGIHHVAILAGHPGEIGWGNEILGVAQIAGNCAPQDNVISFSFANAHPFGDAQRVYSLCWTAAQESAHAFGLDHTFRFQDGTSTCNDPMTYQTDCGGQRFFRNVKAVCGEQQARPCRCGPNQNSHAKLLTVFGEGQSTIDPPTIEATLPVAGTPLGAVAGGQAGSRRGVARVELILNGFVWATAKGAPFGTNGQGNPSVYTIPVPASVPESKLDVVLRAYDDLGRYTDSVTIPSYKGSPTGCTSSSACAFGQACVDGYCRWDPPVGELGDECDYPQFCKSGVCQGTAERQICTQACVPNEEACPDGLDCIETSPGAGVCFGEVGGCCSAGRGARTSWLHGVIWLALFAFVTRRRRHESC